MDATISVQDALVWRNIHLELLAVQEQALRRMRDLVTAHAGSPDDYEPDVQLIATEIKRATDRLRHWEEIVDGLQIGPAQR